jgi:hypothetical protein
MYGTRMNDEQVATLVAKMRERGLCKSKVPARAMLEATGRRMTCHKVRTSRALRLILGGWVVENNADGLMEATEQDLPVITLVNDIAPAAAKGTPTKLQVKSVDGLLEVEYKLRRGKKPIRVGVYPYEPDDVLKAITQQPIEVLIRFMGIHPMLDAYIKHQLATPRAR